MIPALIVKVGSENTEGPTTLIALTMEYTPTPQSRLYGDALSVEIGTAHDRAPLIAGFDPSQLTLSSVKTVLPCCPIRIL